MGDGVDGGAHRHRLVRLRDGLLYTTSARYLFALGREGVLPGALARTSHRHSPVTAAMTVTGLVGACVLLVVNRYDLAGAGDAAYIRLLPWVVLAVFLAGMAAAMVLRRRYPRRYSRIGQFEVAESVDAPSDTPQGATA